MKKISLKKLKKKNFEPSWAWGNYLDIIFIPLMRLKLPRVFGTLQTLDLEFFFLYYSKKRKCFYIFEYIVLFHTLRRFSQLLLIDFKDKKIDFIVKMIMYLLCIIYTESYHINVRLIDK